MAEMQWVTACGDGACVEIATSDDVVLVRKSTDPEGPRLTISRARFDAFIADIKAGAPAAA